MPIPVTVPGTALTINDSINTLAEALLTAFVQLVANGTTGSTTTTPALTIPGSTDPTGAPTPVQLTDASSQLFVRQLCITIANQLMYGSPLTQYSATCASTINIGDIVYASGAGAVDLTDGSSIGTKIPLVGVVISKPTSTSCIVQTSGVINVYTALTPGAKYYADVTGRPTTVAPANPIQIGTALNSTVFLLRIIG